MGMSSGEFRESLRRLSPRVFVDGRQITSIADDPVLAPGINGIGFTYDYTLKAENRPVAVATQHTSGKQVSRLLHINQSTDDLMAKLELVRVLCQETGCAMRYLTHDGFNALYQSTRRTDDDCGTDYHDRFVDYMHEVQDADLTVGIAMTDAKGDRSKRPHQQQNPDTHVHIVERRKDGLVVSGTKAIVTAAPYVHQLLVVPGRAMTEEDADFAVAFAVPLDVDGLTIVARPAGRPGEEAAKFSGRYGQSTGVCLFDRVFVPWSRVFLAGEWQHSEFLTKCYATHHRHTCIAARAGFGDLLIGAGALMIESNGLDANEVPHLRDTMVELITLVESFYACGVAASVYGQEDPSGAFMPDPVYANIGKLLLATKIYDMHRLAHTVSGGLIVCLPGPEEDHNPATAGDLAAVLTGAPDIGYQRRTDLARLLEDLTASYTGGWYSTISLHGGGSPEAMKREIHRSYPIADKARVVSRLLERGVLMGDEAAGKQPGQCCDDGCAPPKLPKPAFPNVARARLR